MAVLLFTSCQTQKKNADSQASAPVISSQKEPVMQYSSEVGVASPKVIVYKTRRNYKNNVPVTLSEDKKSIVSYPHPRDVYTNGKLAVPTKMERGYWLDNRGINANAAFLSYTYEEYAQLSDVPDLNTLYSKIIDKDPITEMWVCGYRHSFSNIVDEINEVISKKDMDKKFKKIK